MKKQVLLFVLMLMPLMASAQMVEINGIYYDLNSTDKVASVTCPWDADVPIPSYRGEVVIPQTVVYEGVTYSVTSIRGFAFCNCSSLTSVTIPNSVTSIESSAFSDCSSLTSVTIPNSVTSIGYYAFSDCSGLTSVTIPNSVTSVGEYAFSGCLNIERVSFNCKEIGNWFDHEVKASIKEVLLGNGVTSIGDYAFSGCSSLTNITIPSSVTSIGEDAFYGCEGFSVHITDLAAWCNIDFSWRSYWAVFPPICYCSNPLANCSLLFLNGTEVKDLVIPNSVTEINAGAFYGYKGLTSVTIANSVTSIREGAFLGCSSLTSVNIPNSVTSIGYYAFFGCSSLTSITIPNSVTSIGELAFSGCSGLTSVTIPNSVTSIGRSVFSDCTSIEKMTFHCQEIGSWFSNLRSVKEVIIGDEVKSIVECAFNGCSNLESVNISDIAAWCNISFSSNPLSYAHHLFMNGEEVKDLIIPNIVTSIGNSAFSGCLSLTSVTIPNSVTSIGQRAFSDCNNLISVNISDVAAWCQLNGGNQLLSPTCHLVINGLEMKNIKNLVIPDGVTSIQPGAFKYGAGLTSVTIGNDVTSIGSEAFYECSDVTSVTIGSNTKSVGAKAFANCPEIKEVYCYAKEVPAISNDTFENSYYVKYATLYVPESSIEQYKASAWSQFGNIVGITGGNEGGRCVKPVITLLANGKIKVESATEGATCVTNITSSNAEPLTDEEISLNTPLTVYTVTSYATKEGYNDSEVATATFRYEKTEGDMNGDGMLNITDVIHLVNMILSK